MPNHRCPTHRRAACGITLIELLFVLAVLAILSGLAWPSLRVFYERSRWYTAQTELLTSLALARSQALFLAQRVAICPSEDGATCRTDRRWETGYLVFRDANHNRRRDGSEPILSQGPYRPDVRVQASQGRPLVVYHPTGGAHGYNVTLRLCGARAEFSSRVIVANSGRARAARGGGC